MQDTNMSTLPLGTQMRHDDLWCLLIYIFHNHTPCCIDIYTEIYVLHSLECIASPRMYCIPCVCTAIKFILNIIEYIFGKVLFKKGVNAGTRAKAYLTLHA